MSLNGLEEREAAQRGDSARSSSAAKAGAGGGRSGSLTASERAYSVAAAAGLIMETPPLRRIYSANTSVGRFAAGRPTNGMANGRHACPHLLSILNPLYLLL